MDRREFLLRTGLVPAATGARSIREGPAFDLTVAGSDILPDGQITLSNGYLAWHLDWRAGHLRSSGFDNKSSGRSFKFSKSHEFTLVFAASDRRVEIPWWKFTFNSESTGITPEVELGLKRGYHQPKFSDESWGAVENLLLRSPAGIKDAQDPIRYDGYGWFRKWFELPEGAQGKPIVLVLGGYDHQDWNEYWIYLNGIQVGHRRSAGRWRTPGQFTVAPGDAAHSALRFGPGPKNLLAVRSRGYDRRFGGNSEQVLRHYVFEPVWADQFISVGSPYAELSDFTLQAVRQKSPAQVDFELRHPGSEIHVVTHYKLDGSTRRKWLEIWNSGKKDELLLDATIDDFTVDAPASEGGPGEPVFLGDEAFAALESPCGLNQGMQGQVRLMHFPGRQLKPGEKVRSHVALLSVAKPGQALDGFISYIQERSPRKDRGFSLYTPYGINDQGGACSPLNDEETLNVLDVLEEWQRKGLKFDYFTLDQGWMDSAGDLTGFAPQCYPQGPSEMLKRVKSLGMKFGLWFSTSGGSWSCGDNPAVWPSLVPLPGGPERREPPIQVYRKGYVAIGEVSHKLCIASDPYFNILRDAVLFHVKNNGMKLFKLDMGNYYCNSTSHQHLPGKYSVEAMYERLLDIAARAHDVDPEICLIWYWGVRSPFFALYGDAVFESGLFLEGSGTSWFPTLYYCDSVTLNLDQSTEFAKTLPPINKDSLGVWLAENRWGNYMANERWKEALIMDLGRGNLVFPQFWGAIYLLNDKDIEFLAELSALLRGNRSLFLRRRDMFGDPWKNEVYGYANVGDDRGFLFLNNVHFEARPVRLNLGELGLKVPKGDRLEIISHYPEKRRLVKSDGTAYEVEDRADIWLRPFETLMLEVSKGASGSETLPTRDVSFDQARHLGGSLALDSRPLADWMELRFGEAAQYEKRGLQQKKQAWAATLPGTDGGQHILAITVRLRQGDKEWRYSPTVVEIVQAVARVDGHELKLIPVPDSRQFGNTQGMGCSWVVYKVRLSPQSAAKTLEFAVHSFIPKDVEAHIEAWAVKRWWEEDWRPIGDGQYGNAAS